MKFKEIAHDYRHLEFKRNWRITEKTAMNLGRCEAYVNAINMLPIPPEDRGKFHVLAFRRGAQATTAIEGNTLSEEDIARLLEERVTLPESRHYQGQEVKNAVQAMEKVWEDVVVHKCHDHLTPRLLCEWNRIIGKDLGPLYDGVPGRFRKDRRVVGKYLAPPYEVVEELVKSFCEWLKAEFRYGQREHSITTAIQQAIAAHVYFEWIHPFADGNGRTGRLIEFYILLREKFPDVTAHVLANHYNQTRQQYAACFDQARKNQDLTEFMDYAIQGLTDGLKEKLTEVQTVSCKIAWEYHIYKVFGNYSDYNKRSVFKRRRALALAMPLNESFTPYSLIATDPNLVQEYIQRDSRMLENDIGVIKDLNLLVEDSSKTKPQHYRVNIQPLFETYLMHRQSD